jgi:hypothetical protein
VAKVLGISTVTLFRYFKPELEVAKIKANSRVAETAYNMAISGKCPAATFFWLKCRAGWREKEHVIVGGDPNNPVQTVHRIERVIVDVDGTCEDITDQATSRLPATH